MERSIKKTYTNGEVTILWQPALCIHSAICFHGLPEVFNPRVRPWVNANGANTEALKQQVAACPSGALSIVNQANPAAEEEPTAATVATVKDGPLVVKGPITLVQGGVERHVQKDKVYLCRCGHSANKPYCDGSHKKEGFTAE